MTAGTENQTVTDCACLSFCKRKGGSKSREKEIEHILLSNNLRQGPPKSLSSLTAYHDSQESVCLIKKDPFFFSAVEYVDELPGSVDMYPIITRSYVPQIPNQPLSITEPDTLLAAKGKGNCVAAVRKSTIRLQQQESIFRRRRSSALKQCLQKTDLEISERGFPGQLDLDEMNECVKFYRELHKRGDPYLEIVYSYKDFEDEAYSICRFLRGSGFKSDAVFENLDKSLDKWEEAKKHDFYHNLEDALGVPLDVFFHMSPIATYGHARNGCPVSYLKAGRLDTDGLFSICSKDVIARYFWNSLIHGSPRQFKESKRKFPNFVRMEKVSVLDLEGFTSSQLSSDTIEFLKVVNGLATFFPESTHCILILNAPSWFALSWTVIKKFLSPRTVKKIEVYSNKAIGVARLNEMVKSSQIPSDFGGLAPDIVSLNKSMAKEVIIGCEGATSSEDKDTCHSIRTVFVKPRKTITVSDFIAVKQGDKLSFSVFTRSTYGASVSVSLCQKLKNKELLASENVERLGKEEGFSDNNPPPTYSVNILSCVCSADGSLSITITGLEDSLPSRKFSRGYFVIVASVEA